MQEAAEGGDDGQEAEEAEEAEEGGAQVEAPQGRQAQPAPASDVLMAQFSSQFDLGDKVKIDGDASIISTVIGFAFYGHGPHVQCAWFANGTHVEAWIGEDRLEKSDQSRRTF